MSQSCGFESQSRNWACYVVRNCPSSRGRHCILQGVAKIMISREGHAWQKKRIGVLPLKQVGSEASAQDKRSALAH
jgi:hypothetical protein